MTALYLYDDAHARGFEPFALTRPASELRAGAELIRRRWEMALASEAARASGAIVAAHLADFSESGRAAGGARRDPCGRDRREQPLCGGAVAGAVRQGRGGVDRTAVAWRRCASRETPRSPRSRMGARRSSRSRCPARPRVRSPAVGWTKSGISSRRSLPLLRDDIDAIGPTLSGTHVDHATVIGPHPVYVEEGATIEPLVVFDVSAGPVMVRAGSTVRAFTRLVGPCAIGADTQILGDRVSGCSIGDQCVVRGEISESIVIGHANKGHEGFVGHSVLGRWVNLGAGTITSNLKNSYGTVSLWTPQGVRDTGTVKLGTFFGDHVKTGIGARLTTGSVIGAGSNVYGSVMPPRYVAPFSWGDGEAMTEYRLEEFLKTTERAMSRRSVALGDAMRRQLSAAHARAAAAR